MLGSGGIELIADTLESLPYGKYHSIWRRLTQLDRAVELRNMGIGYGTIARMIGVSKGEVINWLTGRYHPLRRHVTPTISSQFAYVIGAWIGDGCLFRDRKRWMNYTRLVVKDADFALAFAESLASSFRKEKPSNIYSRKDGRSAVSVNNRILYDFLLASRTRSELLKPVIKMCPGSFLTGFWDAEGSISEAKYGPSIRAFNTRRDVIRLVKYALDRLTVHYTVTSLKRPSVFVGPRNGKVYHRKHRILYTISVRACCGLRFARCVDMKIKRKAERLPTVEKITTAVSKHCTWPNPAVHD